MKRGTNGLSSSTFTSSRAAFDIHRSTPKRCLVGRHTECTGSPGASWRIHATRSLISSGVGNKVVLFGARTGGDGIGGASILASETFEEGGPSKRPSVQVGDPFMEKLLIECCLELFREDLVVGIQDLGGAGLTCATSETASRGVAMALVNARMSDRSFRRYSKVSKLTARLLRKLDRIFAASNLDRTRLTALGVEPERIDAEMVKALTAGGHPVYLAVHANHPRELTAAARAACARLADAGIVLLGQTVLLRGVNDDFDTLAGLMRGMVESRIRPYYLHHPDLAPGTGHFRVSIETGQALVAALRGRLSGLCQPTYMLDIPGGHGKAPIGRSAIAPRGDGCFTVTDWRGTDHAYPPTD